MGHYASYSPGVSGAESLANLNHGFVVTGPGPQTATPFSASDTVTVHNLSGEYVRGTITPVPALAATFTGNRSFVVAPGSAFQETFTRNVIQDIQFVAVDMPVAAGTVGVDTLTANGNNYQLAVKFVEA